LLPMIKKEIKATIHVACTYLKLVHHKIVSRWYIPCNTNKKSSTFKNVSNQLVTENFRNLRDWQS